MGEEFYIILKNREAKVALVVPIGRSINNDWDYDSVDKIINGLEEELLVDIDAFTKPIRELTLEEVLSLSDIIHKLYKLSLEHSAKTYESLTATLKLWGLISIMKTNEVEYAIIGDYSDKYNKVFEDLKKEGYNIIHWW